MANRADRNSYRTMKIEPCTVVDCPACGKLMRLTYVLPAFGSDPEICAFRCDDCGEVRTVTAEIAVTRTASVAVLAVFMPGSKPLD